MTRNPLKALEEYGQSVWLDYIRRDLLKSGGLAKLIDEDGLKGMTSNPTIFGKAIGGSADYDDALETTLSAGETDPGAIYESLAVADIRLAADIFQPVYEATRGGDGYVSLEVSPAMANHTGNTVAEARRLWQAVGRPNVMIKVPGTEAGVPAIRTLIGEGININTTLLFARSAYRAVAQAYIEGLEQLAADGGDVGRTAGVASFFVSRIDAKIDAEIDRRLAGNPAPEERRALESLRGKVAIANAKLAYRDSKEIFAGPRWQALADRGAHPQRLLWASTGTKDKRYSDVLYVEELIGPDTVNTMPPATLDAFRDHGRPRASLEEDVEGAQRVIDEAERLGLDLDGVTTALVEDGVRLFADSFDELIDTVTKKRDAFRQRR